MFGYIVCLLSISKRWAAVDLPQSCLDARGFPLSLSIERSDFIIVCHRHYDALTQNSRQCKTGTLLARLTVRKFVESVILTKRGSVRAVRRNFRYNFSHVCHDHKMSTTSRSMMIHVTAKLAVGRFFPESRSVTTTSNKTLHFSSLFQKK